MHLLRRVFATLVLGAILGPGYASAQVPRNWQMGMQAPSSPVALAIDRLHDLVLVIIALICLLVAGLLVWVLWRFHASRNPNPGRLSHHTGLEVTWTVLPVLILVIIAIPSFRLVYYEDRTANADMTIKVTGHQWYWEYAYPDNSNVNFTSYMIKDEELKPGQLRLLDVDNQLVLPAGKNIRILTTSADVIHSFFIPSLGVQRYAIPGRTIETWVRIDKPGVYYGECNQICGTNHSFMPIAVNAMTEADFSAWVAQAKTKFAGADQVPVAPVAVAQNASLRAGEETR
jgi:cytochrome c oxidase subunit 2